MNKALVLNLVRTKAKQLEKDAPEFAKVLDELADKIEDFPDERGVSREKVFTQIHKDSPITYPAWKCSYCGFEDRYRGDCCKMCGRRFDD